MEAWRWVPGFEDAYMVSSAGRVRSVERRVRGGRLVRDKILAQTLDSDGYAKLLLYRDGVPFHKAIHRIMLESFVGPRPDRHVARHLDDDKSRNVLENLAWGTISENANDAVRNGKSWAAKKTACPLGHRLVGKNLLSTSDGRRRCRSCSNARATCRYYGRAFTKAEADARYLEIGQGLA